MQRKNKEKREATSGKREKKEKNKIAEENKWLQREIKREIKRQERIKSVCHLEQD